MTSDPPRRSNAALGAVLAWLLGGWIVLGAAALVAAAGALFPAR